MPFGQLDLFVFVTSQDFLPPIRVLIEAGLDTDPLRCHRTHHGRIGQRKRHGNPKAYSLACRDFRSNCQQHFFTVIKLDFFKRPTPTRFMRLVKNQPPSLIVNCRGRVFFCAAVMIKYTKNKYLNASWTLECLRKHPWRGQTQVINVTHTAGRRLYRFPNCNEYILTDPLTVTLVQL
jgi:hypothetical protein